MNKHTETCLSAIPLFALASFGIWIFAYTGPAHSQLQESDSITRHFLHYGIFRASPMPTISQETGFDHSTLLPGDLIFGHNPGSSYGHWSHCAIYLGDGQCSQQNLSEGMYIASTHDFEDYYQEVKVFRAPISPEQRLQVCDFVRDKSGSIFDMAARKHDKRLWTCAKLCWAAFAEHDIDLCPKSNHVLPDFLIKSPFLGEIAHFSVEKHNAATR